MGSGGSKERRVERGRPNIRRTSPAEELVPDNVGKVGENEEGIDTGSSSTSGSTSVESLQKAVNWDEGVIGQTEAKRALEYGFFLPRRFPNFFVGPKRTVKNKSSSTQTKMLEETQFTRAILLWGPPGTGKTLIAKSLADAHKAEFVQIEPGNLLAKYVGETEAMIKGIFEKAKTTKTIIFIDEIDSFLRKRESDERSWERDKKTQFLMSIQDFIEKMTVDSALVAATNMFDELDTALLRRFGVHVFCGLPTEVERIDIFKHYSKAFQHALTEEDFQYLGAATPLFSGSDIQRLVNVARMGPTAELQKSTHFMKTDAGKYIPCSPDKQQAEKISLAVIPDDGLAERRLVNMEDFELALQRSYATLSKEQYEKYLKLAHLDQRDLTGQMKHQNPDKLTEFQKELVYIFGPQRNDETPLLSVIGMYERYAGIVSQSNTKIRAMKSNDVVIVLILMIMATWVFPMAAWLCLSAISAFFVISNALGPFFLSLRDAIKDPSNSVIAGQNMSHIMGTLTFVIVLIGEPPFMRYSGWRGIDDLVITFFLLMITEIAASFLLFIRLMANEETKKVKAMLSNTVQEEQPQENQKNKKAPTQLIKKSKKGKEKVNEGSDG